MSAAEAEGYKRILRPKEYAQPSSQHIDCILHALDYMEGGVECLPDILVVLLANNVSVKSEWITECIDIMLNNAKATAVVPVYKDNDHHLLRAKKLAADGTLCLYEKEATFDISTNRQDLPQCYFLAHNFWVLRMQNLLFNRQGQPPWTFMGDFIYPFVIEESIDIHTEQDLLNARLWIEAIIGISRSFN